MTGGNKAYPVSTSRVPSLVLQCPKGEAVVEIKVYDFLQSLPQKWHNLPHLL